MKAAAATCTRAQRICPPLRPQVALYPCWTRAAALEQPLVRSTSGADDGIRTRDPNLGKVVLYQLSHVRVPSQDSNRAGAVREEASHDRHDGRSPLAART